MKTEKGENEEKNGRGTLNRQAAVTIETGKLYPNCQNLISSASFCIRDGSSSRLKRKQTIKIHHKWNQKSLRDIWYCHATGKKKNALKRSVLFYFRFQGKCKHDRSSKT